MGPSRAQRTPRIATRSPAARRGTRRSRRRGSRAWAWRSRLGPLPLRCSSSLHAAMARGKSWRSEYARATSHRIQRGDLGRDAPTARPLRSSVTASVVCPARLSARPSASAAPASAGLAREAARSASSFDSWAKAAPAPPRPDARPAKSAIIARARGARGRKEWLMCVVAHALRSTSSDFKLALATRLNMGAHCGPFLPHFAGPAANAIEAPVTKLTDLIVFNDKQLATRYAAGKIPMATLLEAYLDGAVDIPDMDAFLEARRDLVNFNLTQKHFEFFFTRMIPEVAIHSKSQDERIVREHYDRGDDFFAAFLGDWMVYTSADLQRRARVARAGARQQDEPGVPQADAAPGRRDARHRLRLGHPRDARGEGLRRPVDRHHDSARTRRPSATIASRRRASRSARESSASITATSRASSTTASRASRWSSTSASRTSRSTASSSTTCSRTTGFSAPVGRSPSRATSVSR